MALPKLNDTPKYELHVPSTGQKVRFRPYLVKEEKILMVAMESQDVNQIVNAISDTISACVVDDIDIEKLKMFDVEYMFTQIRGKSVGETSELNMPCEKCEEGNQVFIKYDDIKIDMPEEVSDIIPITDSIKLKMSWPSFRKLMSQFNDMKEFNTDLAFKTLIVCIDSIMTEDEIFHMSDHTEEEANDFIESLTTAQLGKVREYLEAMPRLTYNIEFDCNHCSEHNTKELSGIQDFF